MTQHRKGSEPIASVASVVRNGIEVDGDEVDTQFDLLLADENGDYAGFVEYSFSLLAAELIHGTFLSFEDAKIWLEDIWQGNTAKDPDQLQSEKQKQKDLESVVHTMLLNIRQLLVRVKRLEEETS